jgi:hypothetical protein
MILNPPFNIPSDKNATEIISDYIFSNNQGKTKLEFMLLR